MIPCALDCRSICKVAEVENVINDLVADFRHLTAPEYKVVYDPVLLEWASELVEEHASILKFAEI